MQIRLRYDHEHWRQSNANNLLQKSSWNIICNILFDKRNASAQQSLAKEFFRAMNFNQKKQQND